MKIKKIKEKTSKFANSKIIAALLVFIVCGYVFFFLSNVIISHENNYYLTPLNEKISFDSRSITIIKSTYSPKQNMIEMQLDIENPTYDGEDRYTCQAVIRGNKFLTVTPIVTENNFLVYHISVPKKFTEISIRLKVDSEKHTEILKIYTNVDAIQKTDNITARTAHEYKLERFEANIELYNKQIADINGQIAEHRKTIIIIESNIENLKADRKYQTDQEIKNTDNAINKNNQRIAELQENIKDLQNQTSELQEKISKTKQRIREL